MTVPATLAARRRRVATRRTVLMCRPDHFTVAYTINPWMHPETPTDSGLATRQWQALYRTYLDLGFDVRLIEPLPGLPDMVYAANGGMVIDGVAYGASFVYPERQPEGPAYMDWFRRNGFDVRVPEEVNEGEGDFLLVGDRILAGTGFRSASRSHEEVARIFGREVVTLSLVNPHFYHLDTAIAVLDEGTIAYLPSAFDEPSLAKLADLYPDALLVSEEDAAVFGLNAFSDGCNVVVAAQAHRMHEQLREAGFNPVPVDLSELRRGGGGIKCCTLELHDTASRAAVAVEGAQEPAGFGVHGTASAIALEDEHISRTYAPLPVVIERGEGVWVTDVEGRRYLDCLAAYSAVNFGHGNPLLVTAAREQLDRITLTSRAFRNDRLGPFAAALAALAGKDAVLPMNTGAEAVESAIKLARAWGYRVKGVPRDRATIVVAEGNFHGRTTTLVSLSTDPDAHADFGPYTPGFRIVPYGDARAVEDAIDETTVAVLLEPVQGEAGVIIPPAEYLPRVREVTRQRNVLFIADEVQSGLGRTGATFQCDNAGVVPDLYVLGKALGGGIVPVSAVVGNRDVLGVLGPGQHGSTFGGNPLAAAVGLEVVRLLETGEYQERARRLGAVLAARVQAMAGRGVTAARSIGLWAGIDIDPELGPARRVCEALLARGVLAKDTHGATLRIAPPLTISEAELTWALDQVDEVLTELRG